MELAKYNIDIAALCELRFSESSSPNDLEYSIFWSGKPEGYNHKADKNATASKWQNHDDDSDDDDSEQGQLCYNYQRVCSDNDKPIWKQGGLLQPAGKCAQCIPCTDKLLLIGYFNAMIGREKNKWPLVMGKHGIGKCTSNGELVLALCPESNMFTQDHLVASSFREQIRVIFGRIVQMMIQA